MDEPLEELSVKITNSLKEEGRWKYVFDDTKSSGPWRNRLSDTKTKFSIGCFIDGVDSSGRMGYTYLCVTPEKLSEGSDINLNFSWEQKERIHQVAMPLFTKLKKDFVDSKNQILALTFQ